MVLKKSGNGALRAGWLGPLEWSSGEGPFAPLNCSLSCRWSKGTGGIGPGDQSAYIVAELSCRWMTKPSLALEGLRKRRAGTW